MLQGSLASKEVAEALLDITNVNGLDQIVTTPTREQKQRCFGIWKGEPETSRTDPRNIRQNNVTNIQSSIYLI